MHIKAFQSTSTSSKKKKKKRRKLSSFGHERVSISRVQCLGGWQEELASLGRREGCQYPPKERKELPEQKHLPTFAHSCLQIRNNLTVVSTAHFGEFEVGSKGQSEAQQGLLCMLSHGTSCSKSEITYCHSNNPQTERLLLLQVVPPVLNLHRKKEKF